MNIRDLICTQTRADCWFIPAEGVRVILPQAFYDATMEMCTRTPNETRGLLVCKRCPHQTLLVQSVLTTGKGTSTVVYVDEAKRQAARMLSERHPEFIFIEFHSHTETTNVDGGFSRQDLVSLAHAFNRNNHYKHVLFTPTHISMFGQEKMHFCVSPIHSATDEQLLAKLQEIKDEFNSLV